MQPADSRQNVNESSGGGVGGGLSASGGGNEGAGLGTATTLISNAAMAASGKYSTISCKLNATVYKS